jgi:hypothetical protein
MKSQILYFEFKYNTSKALKALVRNMNKLLILWIVAFFCISNDGLKCQPASSANWLYPEGNSEGTRYLSKKSLNQEIDSIKIKWSTSAISGDIKPLIGNVINNPKIFSGFYYAPNEIVAVQSGKLVVVDATGKTHKSTDFLPYIKDVTSLMDTTRNLINENSSNIQILGLETIELQSPDSLAFGYLAGFDNNADTIQLLRRLAIDMRDYSPNFYASIKPAFGKRIGDSFYCYSQINSSLPTASTNSFNKLQYFRGLAQFTPGYLGPNYPLPDSKDAIESRIHLAAEVNIFQPSMTTVEGNKDLMLLPSYPTPSLGDVIIESYNLTTSTIASRPYLLGLNISNSQITEDIIPTDLSPIINGVRPQIRPFYVHIKDKNTGDSLFVLVAEEYLGRNGSNGTASLHLFDKYGDPVASVYTANSPQFIGGTDHLWSVAVGDIDGNSGNSWEPYYPNNEGQEIIVTQSSRDFVVPASKLFVLRYNSGSPVEKPTPPNATLFPFDTICSARINGWVAAVNDFDGAANNKDEIFLVDGSILRIVQLRDYNTFEFKMGRPLDTLYEVEFKNQTISNVAIADLEGDGYNDIIVTTHDSTYVLGSEIVNTLKVLEPSTYNEYCAGDTVLIKWVNVIKSPKSIDILYQGFLNGVQIDSTILIHSEYENTVDTTEYKYVVDKQVLGTSGYFIVRASNAPNKVFDISQSVYFNKPKINIDPIYDLNIYPGKIITITGSTKCVDSVAVEFSYNDTLWTRNVTDLIKSDGTFSLTVEIPCPDFYECLTKDNGSFLYARGICFRAEYSDTSVTIPLPIKPADFPISIDTCTGGCPTRTLSWDLNKFNFSCNNITIAFSIDGGLTFAEIANVSKASEKFVWNIPVSLPEQIILRFCCQNSCIRTDTLFRNFMPKYINIVAPNPFNPMSERLEVTYTIPEDANVSIKILDAANRLVAEPVKNINRKTGIVYCDYWDGLRADGTYSVNGLYYLSLELSTGAKEIYPIYIKK